jgi:protein O-mannosyl-transferase
MSSVKKLNLAESSLSMDYRRVSFGIEWIVVILLVFGLVFLCFGEAIEYKFLWWDTSIYITNNTCIQELSLANVECIFTEFYFANWHPITSLTYALEYHFFGLNAGPYHIDNLILHGLNGLLVFAVARKIFRRLNYSNSQCLYAAILCCAIFVVHPQHVESVVWIAERKGLLSTIFLLTSLLFYISYIDSDQSSQRRLNYWLALVAFILSLMSKAVAVTWPVLLLLIDVYPLKRIDLSSSFAMMTGQVKSLCFEKLPYFFLTAIMVFITFYGQLDGGTVAKLSGLPMDIRIVNAMYAVFFYIEQWLLPFKLSPYYSLPTFLAERDLNAKILVVSAFLLVTGTSVFFLLKRKPIFFVIWFLILVALSPMLGIIQVGSQAAADRYAYFTLLPLSFLVCAGGVQFFSRSSRVMKWTGVFAAGLTIVFFSHTSRTYAKIWKNDFTLWSYAIRGESGNHVIPILSLATNFHRNGEHELAVQYYLMAESFGVFPTAELYVAFAKSYRAIGADQYAIDIYNLMLTGVLPLSEEIEQSVNKELKLLNEHISSKTAE